jgi:TonB family protein
MSQSSAASVAEPLVFSGKIRPSPSAASHSASPAARPQEAVLTSSLLDKKAKVEKARSSSAVAGLVAAGVLFAAAGGGWYWWQHGRLSSEHRSSTPASASSAAAPAVVAVNSPEERVVPGEPKPVPSAAVSTSVHSSSRPADGVSDEAVTKPEKTGKKRAVPQFRLSSPVVSRPDSSITESSAAPEVAPQVSENVPPAPLSGMVPTQDRQPTAPRISQAVPPKRISWIAPQYPPLARLQRIQGEVTLDVLVEANGRPSTIKVLSGPTLLQQAAVNAVRQWKYQPGTVGGSPVPVHISVAVTFRID